MAMLFGTLSKGGSKRIKWLCIAFFILLVVGAMVYFYYWLVHPLLTRFIIPTTDIHTGTSYFEDGSYLEYEDGERFEEVLEGSQYLSYGTLIDFYHVDNHLRDNPLYGKCSDVFAVDIQLSPERYAECNDTIVDRLEYCCELGDYKLYLCGDGVEENAAFLVASCDATNVLRCVLVTDKEPERFVNYYGNVLLGVSGLDWWIKDSGRRTGDGPLS